MKTETDIVESLIRSAGRRVDPPEDARQRVFVAAHAAFREKAARRRERLRGLWAGAAAVLVVAVAVVARWSPSASPQAELGRLARVLGEAEVAEGGQWRPAADAREPLVAGIRVRTLGGGRLALALAGGESVRLAPETEVMLDGPGRLYLQHGTIYVDSGAAPSSARVEVVTPAGTARDVGTQFELRVAGAALRLRVREGLVALDRGGESLTGRAGEEVSFDSLGGVARAAIAADDAQWRWVEGVAPMPDMDGKPAATLIAWVARETGRRLHYESPLVESRALEVILHGDIRHLAPMEALEAFLATTDLMAEVRGDTLVVMSRSSEPPGP
jgi:ferric-dicitrate binding protein FerR (iron transport regulator)